jgi:hypothetical protein
MRRTKQKTVLALATALTAALAVTSTGGTAAAATPKPGPNYAQPGVIYTGVTTGGGYGVGSATAGARVEIEVAADGLSISRFTVVDVLEPDTQFQTCGGARFSKTVTGAFPVYTQPGGDPADFVFVSTMPDNNPAATPSEFEFDATIAPGVMSGRFSYQPDSGCGSGGNIAYAVTAPGGCMGSPERVALQSRSDTLAKAIKKLAKKIAQAKAADKHGKAKKLGKKKRAAKREFKAINKVLPYFCNLADSI